MGRGLPFDAVWAKLAQEAHSRVAEFAIGFPVTKNLTAAGICYMHFQT